ncbi:hypothetical protein BOTNAR_1780g00020 [Botryotinia narcissicola]|uniref:Uncharacterized protein n=1 Tax=Botryotinia narcissicola TaxID=278944 RepID=A0A4Z1HA26_9HELO|nr:hypothetical protein BOTNAR_1780g00020 [Botryotinia narcissicola]
MTLAVFPMVYSRVFGQKFGDRNISAHNASSPIFQNGSFFQDIVIANKPNAPGSIAHDLDVTNVPVMYLMIYGPSTVVA